MSKPALFWQCSYETESSWAEATNTFGTRLQLAGPPTLNLTRDSIPVPISQQFANEGIANVTGVYGGSFTIKLYLTGHGGATTGSLTATDLYTLLKNFVGDGDATQVGDTSIDTVTSATQFTTSGTLVTNDLIRIGDRGDGRGEGRPYAVNNISTSTLLTGLATQANVADKLYAMLMIRPNELPASFGTVASTRWNFMSANDQFYARGCYPMSITFSGMNHGEVPTVDLTYGVSYWLSGQNDTFPDVTATAAKTAAPVVMSSCWMNDVGTTTSSLHTLRSWSLTIDQQVQPLMGPGGVNDYQIVTGAVRLASRASFSLTFDKPATGTTTYEDIYTGGTNQHVLVSLSSGEADGDGKKLAWYFNNARCSGAHPIQFEQDGVNRTTLNFEALTGTTTSSAAAAASWRLGMG